MLQYELTHALVDTFTVEILCSVLGLSRTALGANTYETIWLTAYSAQVVCTSNDR